ncbi:MAG: PAS domain S-box protein [Candidatus Marinimicrobia bacterium]|nr:PAS domain S-box protein [Candidatus Neomarinimicrobiota bacterium]
MQSLTEQLRRLIAAPDFGNAEKNRTAGLLNAILVGGLALVLVAGIVNVPTSPRPLSQMIAFVVLLLWLMAAWLLFRRGHLRLVSILLPVTAWIMITLLVIYSGGIQSPNLAGYIALILGVVLLFGLRYGIAVTVVNAAAVLIIMAAGAGQMLPPQQLIYSPISMWTVYLIWSVLALALLYLGTREINFALQQASIYAKEQSSLARRQAAIAELGQAALETSQIAALFDRAVTMVAEILAVEVCTVLELLPTGDRLILRAGVGWRDGLVGTATVSAGTHLQAGYTLASDKPVVVEDQRAESRFAPTELLRQHGVVSGLTVIIHAQGRPFGVLGAHSANRHKFNSEEIYFMEAISNIMATAIDRIAAEEALKESEAKYRSILKNIEEGYFEVDLAGNLTFFNEALARIAGVPRDQLLGLNNRDYTTLATSQKMNNIFRTIYRTGQPARVVDYEIIRGDGSTAILELSASLMRDLEDKPIGFRGVVRDITERREIMNALTDSEQMLREIHDNALEGIFRTTKDGKILYANKACARMFGYPSVEEFLAVGVETLYTSAEDRDHALSIYGPDDRVQNIELRLRRRDGSPFWVQENAIIVRDRGGKVLWFEGFLSDITARKEAEEALVQSEAQLRQAQKMEAVGHLAGGIAHDFNNVMAQISAASELLAAGNNDMDLQRYVDIVQGSVERGKSVTDRILRFSRQQEPSRDTFYIMAQLSDVIQVVKHMFPKNIAVRLKRYQGKDLAVGDKAQLHHAFMNVCMNAADAMPNGGRLTLSMRKAQADEPARFGRDPGKNYVCVVFEDDGVGMSGETMERIFDPFFSTKDPGKGTGLGLSIVYKIINDYQGWIDVDSSLGQGTTFTLSLPLSTDAPPARPAQKDEKPGQGHGERILVVEDEPALRSLLEEILGQRNYAISLAENGRVAWEIYQDKGSEIDLVITDLGMPEMGGRELAQKLHSADPRVKIIVTSGYLDPGDEADLKGYGVQGILNKPFKLKEVIETVGAVLGD